MGSDYNHNKIFIKSEVEEALKAVLRDYYIDDFRFMEILNEEITVEKFDESQARIIWTTLESESGFHKEYTKEAYGIPLNAHQTTRHIIINKEINSFLEGFEGNLNSEEIHKNLEHQEYEVSEIDFNNDAQPVEIQEKFLSFIEENVDKFEVGHKVSQQLDLPKWAIPFVVECLHQYYDFDK
jgi:hypothetical protein